MRSSVKKLFCLLLISASCYGFSLAQTFYFNYQAHGFSITLPYFAQPEIVMRKSHGKGEYEYNVKLPSDYGILTISAKPKDQEFFKEKEDFFHSICKESDIQVNNEFTKIEGNWFVISGTFEPSDQYTYMKVIYGKYLVCNLVFDYSAYKRTQIEPYIVGLAGTFKSDPGY